MGLVHLEDMGMQGPCQWVHATLMTGGGVWGGGPRGMAVLVNLCQKYFAESKKYQGYVELRS